MFLLHVKPAIVLRGHQLAVLNHKKDGAVFDSSD